MNRQNMRVFVAIELPESIVKRLERFQERLKSIIDGVRWVKPASIHLTLKFLGDTDSEKIDSLSGIIRKQAASQKAMTFSMGGPGVFPDMARPRVLWIGLRGDIAPLSSLQERMEGEFYEMGYPKEERAFRPHLTLGRFKSPGQAVKGLKEAMEQKEDNALSTSFTVNCITLFKSELRPQGAIYTPLERFDFSG